MTDSASTTPNNSVDADGGDDADRVWSWLESIDPEAPGIDPDDIVDLDGELYVWRYGPGATITIPQDGTDPRYVVVPALSSYPSEDAIRLSATQFARDHSEIDRQVGDDEVASIVQSMRKTGIFRTMVDQAVAVVRESLRVDVTITEDDADSETDGLTIEEAHDAAAEATKALHDEITRMVRATVTRGKAAREFQHQFARDVLTTAWAWAVDDMRDIGRDCAAQYPSIPPMTAEEFDAGVKALFYDGHYVSRSLMTTATNNVNSLLEMVSEGMRQHPNLGRQLYDAALRRKRRGGQFLSETTATTTVLPGFQDGRGWVPNDLVTRGAIVAFQDITDGAPNWEADPTGWPRFSFQGNGWETSYRISPEDYPTTDAAWAAIRQLDDDAADTAIVALARWLANNHTDPAGMVNITIDDILADRGKPKHVHGGYRPADRIAVSRQMEALGSLIVEGHGIKVGKTKLTPRGRFLVISSWLDQERLDGSPLKVVFKFRIGDWGRDLHGGSGSAQLASMMQRVIQYDSHNGILIKRLGRLLTWQFRLRAYERSYEQPWIVRQLLRDAGIQTPEKNPYRFMMRIEGALRELALAGIIGHFEYLEDVHSLPKHRWFDQWLDCHLIIAPPISLMQAYGKIGQRRARKLADKARNPSEDAA